MQTALGNPVVPEEHMMATVCSPPSFNGSGLKKTLIFFSLWGYYFQALTGKTFLF